MKNVIYCIKNKITEDIYIGSAINLIKRKRVHLCQLRKNIHHSIILQRAWNKYGEENFEFIILLQCNSENLIEQEQKFLDKYKPIYNIQKIADNCLGITRSVETRLKISKALKGKTWKGTPRTEEQKRNHSLKMKGRKCSLETRSKISESHKKRTSFTIPSPETRIKAAEASKKPVIQINLNNEIINEYTGLIDVVNQNIISLPHLSRALKDKTNKLYKGYIWKYKNENTDN